MPSDLSSWLIAVPQDGDSEGLFQELQGKLDSARVLPKSNIAELQIPSLKAGTLDELLNLSEELPKTETFFTGVVAKLVETLRNLLNNDPQRLAQHTIVDDQTPEGYLLKGWKWNSGKYITNRKLREILDALAKEMTSIDNIMKAKLNNYNLAKGQLVQMQRKKSRKPRRQIPSRCCYEGSFCTWIRVSGNSVDCCAYEFDKRLGVQI